MDKFYTETQPVSRKDLDTSFLVETDSQATKRLNQLLNDALIVETVKDEVNTSDWVEPKQECNMQQL
jgi:hypothetical protein